MGIENPLCNIIFEGESFDRDTQDVLDANKEFQDKLMGLYREPRTGAHYIQANQKKDLVTQDILSIITQLG